ncbi:MAG: phosphoenolpyruvate synthase [Candidatus Diapherotrites archaeon]|nr:phosphoenolpyruvate synthase [Candidatus Diapherotrites archaeon]
MPIAWFNELSKTDIPKVGGKGANLGEMTKAGFPVPTGFVVTADTYFSYVKRMGIQSRIMDIVQNLDVNDTAELQEASKRISEIMVSVPMPPDITDEIVEAYRKLQKMRGEQIYVAARSSATAEDLPEASFAGQQATFLDVQGEMELIKAVRKCWASLYTPRAIFYREQQGFPHDKVAIAVVVQEMIKSEVAGVMFTSEPTGDRTRLVIEAAYGLGEAVVSGSVTPDTYKIQKEPLKILSKKLGKQHFKIVRSERGLGTTHVDIPPLEQNTQKLSDERVLELSEMGNKIEAHYEFPQDIEWALQEGELFILQSRAITTLESKAEEGEVSGELLTKGMGASPGIGAGIVKIVMDMEDLPKVQQGDMLITKMTNPDMVPAMKRAAAIVTDDGGITCHAAIVSRELGIPCIVGTENITQLVKDGDEITVDASKGLVYKGRLALKEEKEEEGSVPDTRIKVYMNLGVPEKAEEYSTLPADGVGLMREEFIIATHIKDHPLKLIKEGREDVFVSKLAEGVATVAKAFAPRPVVLRLSDFKTNEYKDLVGGQEFEPKEDNPMIGWRGCSRYYSPEYEKAFKLELKAVRKVREQHKNLWLMLPFVRTLEEAKKVIELMKAEGLERGPDLKLWFMAEIPSNALLAEEFAELCDGFSIGSNDLTQLVLGVDRDSEVLGKMQLFDERDEAVKKAVRMIIDGAHKKGKTCSLCGQAPSNYPEFTEFLVEAGIDSISVNPDVVKKTKRIVAEKEKIAKQPFTLFGFKF